MEEIQKLRDEASYVKLTAEAENLCGLVRNFLALYQVTKNKGRSKRRMQGKGRQCTRMQERKEGQGREKLEKEGRQ